MKLLIDMDEVLCYWSPRVVDLWNLAHPDKAIAGATRWDTNGFIGHAEAQYFTRYLMRQESFWSSLTPLPGAPEGFTKLLDAGHDVRIVTQVLPDVGGAAYQGKLEWISRHLPAFSLDKVCTTKFKGDVAGDLLLDDAPHQLSVFPGITVAMDYVWNRNIDVDYRVTGWDAFVNLVGYIAKARGH